MAKRKLKSLVKDFFLVRNYPVLRGAFQIPSHLTIPERVMLYKLSKGSQYGLEIGSFIGTSASCFCLGMSSDGHLTCVDTWQNDAMAEGRRSTFEEFQKNTDKFSRIITPIRGKSIDAINGITIPPHSLDFLFIDGDHSYESVRQDFLLYSKLLRNGGLLIFHD